MKKLLILASLTGFLWLFIGCSDDDTTVTTNAEKVIGKWIATEINGVSALTDSLFSMEFRTDNVEVYARGSYVDSNNSKWTEGKNYTYSINNDLITINGTDESNKSVHAEFKIHSLTNSLLTYSVVSFIYNGVSTPDTKIYTCKKATNDYASQIVGIWYGKCTSANTTDTAYHYWEYLADGKYNYYYQDANSKWIKKSDNAGGYYLYGDLFASNYTNDQISGVSGTKYECWNISIANGKMKWTGKRVDKIVTYEMIKSSIPVSPNPVAR